MTKEQIIESKCFKHVKIYKLKQVGLTNKEIATCLGTNVGHVHNELKRYSEHEELKIQSDAITAQ